MSRYIDADAVLELIKEEFHKTDVNGAEQIGVLMCHKIVRNAPTADVVEVVRCKDCKYRLVPHRCALWFGSLDDKDYFCERGEDFYCSYGERNDECESKK